MPEQPDVVILCGGQGTRLRSVISDRPKPMAEVAGRPFLEHLLQQIRRARLSRVILAVGYQAGVIEAHFGRSAFGLTIDYAMEFEPLGTGGALRNAVDAVQSDFFIAMNGDSYINVDLAAFAASHRETRTDMQVVAVPVDGRNDAGGLLLGPNGEIRQLNEKSASSEARYLNAGVYSIRRELFAGLEPGVKVSLETQLFPEWLETGKTIRAYVQPGPCLDIGTPERFAIAEGMLKAITGEDSLMPGEIHV